jgi:hypothetical protein
MQALYPSSTDAISGAASSNTCARRGRPTAIGRLTLEVDPLLPPPTPPAPAPAPAPPLSALFSLLSLTARATGDRQPWADGLDSDGRIERLGTLTPSADGHDAGNGGPGRDGPWALGHGIWGDSERRRGPTGTTRATGHDPVGRRVQGGLPGLSLAPSGPADGVVSVGRVHPSRPEGARESRTRSEARKQTHSCEAGMSEIARRG